MKCLAEEGKWKQRQADGSAEAGDWKKTVAETLQALQIIPCKFTGKLVVSFKDGGVSYLEKTETLK